MEELDTRPTEEINGGDEQLPLTFKDKLSVFCYYHWQGIVIVVAPLLSLCLVCGHGPTEKWQWCAYTLVVMATYWVTECIPLPVTALLPIVIFPLTGVMDTNSTCKCYMNDTIFMFLGSMMLAYSIGQSNLHIRLALFVIRLIGYSHYKLLFAICLVTTFISMWITNTAATVMVVPIVFALLQVFEDQGLMRIYDVDVHGNKVASDMSTCYFCGVTYSATIGGIGTIVGTATNLAFKGLFHKAYSQAPEHLSFPLFSAFSIPYLIVLEACMFLCLILLYFGFLRPKSKQAQICRLNEEAISAAQFKVESDWKKLGFITVWELWVIVLFAGAIAMFFSRSPRMFDGWGDLIKETFKTKDKFVKDSTAALLIAILMMLIPNTCEFFRHFMNKDAQVIPDKPIRAVLSWTIMDTMMPYSFMFLLGGGFALSTASKKEYSNLNGVIGEVLQQLQHLPNSLILFLLIVVTIFLTNFAANVAVANVLCPIAMQMAHKIGYNPLWYCIACGFSASYCFCLPVGTPGNLVVQSAASIPTGKMVKAGLGPTITTIVVSWIAMYLWAPVIWPDLTSVPSWIDNIFINIR